jgi:phage shock protein C
MSSNYERLYRSRSERIITGLCGGIGVYFKVDPIIIRAIFLALAFIGGGGVLLYIILAIVVPLEPAAPLDTAALTPEPQAEADEDSAEDTE